MIIILWIVGALAVLVGIVALAGALMPVRHVATVRATFHRTPEAIWSAITTIGDFPSWREGLKSVEIVDDDAQHPRWRETGSFGTITMEREEAAPPRKMVSRIVGTESGFGGRWIYEIEPDGAGTRLTITEEGEVYNPIFRFMSRFIFGHSSTMKAYLKGLGKKFGENAEPAE
jgi:hypothetical protein